jgi:hypothetical protein
MNRFVRALLLMTATAVPLVAEAQDRVGVTIQAGVITGDDAAPLEDFARPLFTASIQHVFARHFVIEGEVSYWTLERVIERGPHNVEGPQGVIGTVTGSRVVDSHSFFNYGINALVKSTGAVRVFGGAGVGLSSDQNVYRQQSFGCSTSLDPRVCDEFVNDRGRGPIVMVRALGGIEIPITGTIELVGAIRAEKTAWEDRSNWLSATAGVRFSFD